MARRALLTERERELIADPNEEDRRYVAISRVRRKITEELSEDIDVLRQHHPGLLEELQDVVCEEVPEDSSKDPPETREPQRREIEFEEEPPEEIELPDEDEISDGVWRVVDQVSAGWADDARLMSRRMAAATALQYALSNNVYLGRSSDVVAEIRERYSVLGQNEETYWRQNLRDVLGEVGEYNKGYHGYAVENLERDDE